MLISPVEGTILWISWPAVPGWPGPVDGLCIEVICRKLEQNWLAKMSVEISAVVFTKVGSQVVSWLG